MQPNPTFPPADLDSMPTMALTRDLLDRWGAERVSRHFGLSVEQLLTLARDLEGMPGSRASLSMNWIGWSNERRRWRSGRRRHRRT